MPFDPLINEPEPAPAEPKPDPMDAVNAQLALMREQLNAAYQANKGLQQSPQVQYVPVPYGAPQEEPELSEADMLADLPGTVYSLAERIAAEKEQKLREELGQHLGRFYEKDFERDVKDLAAQPHYKFVEKELKEHFAAHPEEKYQPGRLREKYYALVGERAPEIQAAERAEAEANEPARVRAVDYSIPTSSSAAPRNTPKEEVVLSPDEERTRVKYNKQFGLNMSANEWADIRDGKLLPNDYADTEDEI